MDVMNPLEEHITAALHRLDELYPSTTNVKNALKEWFATELRAMRERCEKERYWSPCVGCPEGHPSFWKTVVESKAWDAWYEYQCSLPASHPERFDIDECQECGYISPEHFKAFLAFTALKDELPAKE